MRLYSMCKNQQWRIEFNTFPFENSFFLWIGLDVVRSTGNVSSRYKQEYHKYKKGKLSTQLRH